ncbi:MAG: c-type cytochrome [Methylotenera sp.]|nr:c-type cytochrome [Methylotenera sp.]MDP2281729.1 c-type cytochrome [Methylotenera sp.]MDP3060551.1 c-type cytochrome [Methylotenera sp.]
MKKIITMIGLATLLITSVARATEVFVLSANPSHIHVLAASCATCHGTNGNGVDQTKPLAGIGKTDFLTKMLAFKSGERKATVMHRHAKGLNAQEIEGLAAYFSAQIPHQPSALPSQVLNKNHAN